MFAGVRTSFKAQMKIIKETYGSQKSAVVTLYYVIFSEFNVNQNTINNLAATQPPTFNPRFTQTSINQFEDMVESEDDSDNLFFNSKDDQTKIQSITGKSISTDSLMAPASASISSSQASSKSHSDASNEIKYIEEGIDYDRTPKPLLLLKISLVFLFLIALVLASVQFGLNRQWQNETYEYQSMLVNTVQCEENIQSLLLMARSYMNINLGLEPNLSDHFKDRKGQIRTIGLQLIEQSRLNMKEVQQFLTYIEGKKEENVFTQSNVTLYDLYLNNTVDKRELSRFYSLNQWLVKIHDILIQDNFQSRINTYLFNGSKAVTQADQAAFFFFINGEQEIISKLAEFSIDCEVFIGEEVELFKFINTIFIIITGIILVILILSVVYFMIFFYAFKFKVLTYFAELEKTTIQINELCALEFSQFLISDNYDVIKRNQQTMQEYELAKTQNNLVDLMASRGGGALGDKKSAKLQKELLAKIKKRDKINKKMNKRVAFNEDGIMEEKKEESKSEDDEEQPKKHKKQQQLKSNNVDSLAKASKDQKLFKMNSDLPSLSDVSGVDIADIKLQYNGEQLPAQPVIQNKLIFARLKELRMKRISQLLVVGTGISMFLIVYFIVQYLLFDKQQSDLSGNSSVLRQIQMSLQCTSNFIYEVRDYQSSNSTDYNLDRGRQERLSILRVENKISQLNQTYQECIKLNQQVDNWLRSYSDGDFYFDKKERTLCSYMAETDMFTQQLTNDSCTSIYQGILTQNGLQQTSLFLQDALYSAIRFDTQKAKSDAFVRSELKNAQAIEMLDAISFYQQHGLRTYYQDLMLNIQVHESTHTIVLALFIVFVVMMFVCQMMINCLMLHRIRVQFWNAFYILKLLPRDDIKPEFIKRINDFLSKA